MGYLHEGHLSLIRASKSKCDATVVSIFVNPTQFSPNEDLKIYPRKFERDEKLLIEEGVDYLFYPSENEIYNINFKTYVEVAELSSILEGKTRPTHFRGVTTIVLILFNIIHPDYSFFGQKDAQQAAIIKQMVYDLKLNCQIEVLPIVREKDGLAFSSRNIFLSDEERLQALSLNNCLHYAVKLIEGKERNPQVVIDNLKNILNRKKLIKLDYIAIVNSHGFTEVDFIDEGNEYLVLIAALVGKTRLIDNVLISI